MGGQIFKVEYIQYWHGHTIAGCVEAFIKFLKGHQQEAS
jgi:hypothetical protein